VISFGAMTARKWIGPNVQASEGQGGSRTFRVRARADSKTTQGSSGAFSKASWEGRKKGGPETSGENKWREKVVGVLINVLSGVLRGRCGTAGSLEDLALPGFRLGVPWSAVQLRHRIGVHHWDGEIGVPGNKK